MTPADLDGIEREAARHGVTMPPLMVVLVSAMRVAWAERDTFRAEAERAFGLLDEAKRERDAYVEAFEAHIAHSLGVPDRVTAIDRLDRALAQLRSVGWKPEHERKGAP